LSFISLFPINAKFYSIFPNIKKEHYNFFSIFFHISYL
jgi:hypothetical protein